MKKILLSAVLILTSSMVSANTVNMPSAPDFGTTKGSNSIPSASYKKTSTINYSAVDKKQFYDAFEQGFFQGLTKELKSQGFTAESIGKFTLYLQANFNRSDLEKSSWACVSKYTPEELENSADDITNECFGTWLKIYTENNMTAATKFLKK